MLDSPFLQTAAVLGVAALIGMVAVALRQPLIVAFIAVGVLVGPAGFGLATIGSELELLSGLGIAILLFLVGLKLDPTLVRTTGPVALATGLGQVLLTWTLGLGIALALGLELVPALYVGLALTFSSTIIIVKLLSDKRELDDLHGRIAVGVLIIQDIVVIVALIVVTAIGDTGAADAGTELVQVLVRGAAFLGGLLALMRWVLPHLMGRVARNRELLLLFGVAWAVGLAAGGELLGFSVEVGAFLAGFSLAATPYREAIASRLVGLRDFLLLFFFINLGATLELERIAGAAVAAGALSLFVLVGKPLIVLAIMGMMRYRMRTALLTGLSMAQISEFSLILVALGARVGHIDESTVGTVTLVGLITIGLSTYFIVHSRVILERLAPFLSRFDRRPLAPGEQLHGLDEGDVDVIVYGGGRHGTLIAQSLRESGRTVVVVDIDPDALKRVREDGLDVLFGDAEDPEFLLSIPLDQAEWVVSTIKGLDVNLSLIHGLREAEYEGKLAFTAHDPVEAARLEQEDVDLVIAPFAVAAERLVDHLLVPTATDGEAG